MSSLITAITAIVTALCGWIGQFVTVITSNDLILLFAVLPLCGLGVGMLKRLLRVD